MIKNSLEFHALEIDKMNVTKILIEIKSSKRTSAINTKKKQWFHGHGKCDGKVGIFYKKSYHNEHNESA